MKELRDILQRINGLSPDQPAILATVVDVKGSGYRLSGARMLMDEDGHSIGSVSGGCLEADVLERARSVLKTGEPAVVVYDSTNDDNSVFGLQMGCRGVIRVLIERANDKRFFQFLNSVLTGRKTSAVATLIACNGRASLAAGHRFYWWDGSLDANGSGALIKDLRSALTRDIRDSINERRSRTASYKSHSGELEFFIEVIQPPPVVSIFGAGHDAIPLTAFARQLGWIINVIDRRPAYAVKERLPDADKVIVGHAHELDNELFSDENSVAVVMTHHYDSDREIVRRLAWSNCRYIGILGPKQRTADLLSDLRKDGVRIDREFLDRIHSPVGLDIGASTPEGIALSIISEIQAVLTGRDGGHLKHRTKPIYDR